MSDARQLLFDSIHVIVNKNNVFGPTTSTLVTPKILDNRMVYGLAVERPRDMLNCTARASKDTILGQGSWRIVGSNRLYNLVSYFSFMLRY